MVPSESSVAAWSARARIVGMALAGAGLLAGCGQKGPLTLPKPLPPAASASAGAPAALPP